MPSTRLGTLPRVITGISAVIVGVALVSSCSSSKSAGGSTTPAPGAATTPVSGAAPVSGGVSGGASTATGKAVTIDVKNFSFEPQKVTVAIGTVVTWKFEDSAQHTVKADNGAFTSKPLNNNQTYAFTFNTAGTYSYICSIHQYMTGSVTVK
jgi:plastocyanin